MEKELSDLQERYTELTESYEASQLECSAVKETLRCEYETLSRTPKILLCGIRAWDAPGAEPSDPPLLDAAGILYEPTNDAV